MLKYSKITVWPQYPGKKIKLHTLEKIVLTEGQNNYRNKITLFFEICKYREYLWSYHNFPFLAVHVLFYWALRKLVLRRTETRWLSSLLLIFKLLRIVSLTFFYMLQVADKRSNLILNKTMNTLHYKFCNNMFLNILYNFWKYKYFSEMMDDNITC